MRASSTVIWGTVLLALALVGLPAAAQDVVTSPLQDSHADVVWTQAKKAAALPMPLIEVTGEPAPASILNTSAGTPGGWNGHAPGGKATKSTQERTEPTIGAGSTIWYSYPPPFSLEIPILDYFVIPLFPVTTLGKLFFDDASGSGFVCSASSITSAGDWGPGNRQTVMTAGHCCSDGSGSFFNSWVFEPAHVSGTAPLGSWAAASATVFTAWHNNEDLSRDECVLQMFKLNGQNINDAVGALGYAFDQPLPQHYHATGWPAEAPFPGTTLFIVTASDAETDTTVAGELPFTHGIGSSMTGGSSGGAWIKNYQSGFGANQWNGLNSYKYTSPSRPLEMFGPYADFDVFDVLLRVVATAPAAP